jgi:hypothetical protein
MSLVIAVVLLIAPAAVHRLTFQGRDDPQFVRLGSLIITLALLPLAASICCDTWVALHKLTASDTLPTVGALVTAVFLLTLWFVVPLSLRARVRARGQSM